VIKNEKNERLGTILGILLTITILISGSAVAVWHYARVITLNDDTTNEVEILYAPDDVHATLGENGPPKALGFVVVDLGVSHEIPHNTEFWVFATPGAFYNNYKPEEYLVAVGESSDSFELVGGDDDQGDHVFTTPNKPGNLYRYILITGTDGKDGAAGDTIYGPEVDAVGWQ
jgi:hypothetical protein